MATLPIYYAEIDYDDEGIQFVSLVDFPAVESNFITLAAQKKSEPLRFATIEDGEQHLLVGVVMRADFPIYRYDERGEYYIVYRKEMVRRMAEKMLYDGRTSAVNIMHTPVVANGINLQELFIKDSEKGIVPKGFEDIEEGSLFAVYKVHNAEVWNAIKRGDYAGFSLEGLFELKEADPDSEMETLLKELEEMNATINGLINKD